MLYLRLRPGIQLMFTHAPQPDGKTDPISLDDMWTRGAVYEQALICRQQLYELNPPSTSRPLRKSSTKKPIRNLTTRKRNEKGQWIRAIDEEELDDETFDDVSETGSDIYEESDSEFTRNLEEDVLALVENQEAVNEEINALDMSTWSSEMKKDFEVRRCFLCHKSGHRSLQYPTRKNKRNNPNFP